MILTNCAACAAPLAHNAPRCVRCKLRYCNATCQHDHWRREDPAATLDDLNEAVTTLEDTVRIARRVMGGAHPLTTRIEGGLRDAQAELQGKLLSFDVSLRFAVGARVECARGGDTWAPGRVIKLHYHEEGFEPGFFAPYQIELDDGGLIYAPDDDDNCIREAT